MSERSTRFGTLDEVANGVFSYFQPEGGWAVNTNGIVVLDDVVIVVDTCASEARTRALSDAVGWVAGTRRRILVNTHHHIDHTNGNGHIGASLIVGSPRCRERLLEPPPPPPAPEIFPPADFGQRAGVPPNLVVSGDVTWFAERRITLLPVARRAHTDGDLLVWLPDDGILFAGDVVINASMPLAMEGSIAGTLQTLHEIDSLGAGRIVPGHGRDVGPEFTDVLRRYFEFVRTAAAAGLAEGRSPLQIAKGLDLGEFEEMLDTERIVGNLHRAVAEERGDGDAALPIAQVMAEMVEYNGGPLTRTV